MKCKICGKEFDKVRYAKPHDDICSSACFTVDYWLERANNPDEFVIIDHVCYYVADERKDNGFRGFDGRKFKIRMLADGREFTTTNLWLNGRVPDEFLSRLPDNAEFVK